MLTPSSSLCFYNIFLIYFFGSASVSPKAWLSSGSWWHTTNAAVDDRGDEEICFTLSVCAGLPASLFFFFVSTNWHWLRGGIVLAKM